MLARPGTEMVMILNPFHKVQRIFLVLTKWLKFFRSNYNLSSRIVRWKRQYIRCYPQKASVLQPTFILLNNGRFKLFSHVSLSTREFIFVHFREHNFKALRVNKDNKYV